MTIVIFPWLHGSTSTASIKGRIQWSIWDKHHELWYQSTHVAVTVIVISGPRYITAIEANKSFTLIHEFTPVTMFSLTGLTIDRFGLKEKPSEYILTRFIERRTLSVCSCQIRRSVAQGTNQLVSKQCITDRSWGCNDRQSLSVCVVKPLDSLK